MLGLAFGDRAVFRRGLGRACLGCDVVSAKIVADSIRVRWSLAGPSVASGWGEWLDLMLTRFQM